MQILILSLIMIVSLVLQGILKYPYRPDLILVFLMVVAAKRKTRELYGFSFAGGLLFDLLYTTSFVTVLSKSAAALIVSIAKKNVAMDSFRFSMLLVFVASPLLVLADAIIYMVFYSQPIDIIKLLVGMVVITISNLVITPLYCLVFDRFIKERL